MVFEAGANWVSVLSSATLSTMEVVAKEAFSHGGEVQIELQEDWTMENAMKWQALGIKQVIIHRSRDTEKAGMSWGSKDLDIVKDLSDKGFKVSVTGKLSIDDIAVFKGIPVYAFVAGRAIRDAGNPTQAAKDFQNAIKATWS
jgi:3-keto-L-gulonate-6-phosphate decarboxylase